MAKNRQRIVKAMANLTLQSDLKKLQYST